MSYTHTPVLFNEVMEGLNIRPSGVYIDGTFGRGGHSRGILERLDGRGRLYALDRDPEAVRAAQEIRDERFSVSRRLFSELAEFCAEREILGRVDGIVLDLGVSSPQLDDASRGFSFSADGPLDMRMSGSSGVSAAALVNTSSREELSRIFRDFGEERYASRVAAAIVRERGRAPFTTTGRLAALISAAVPGYDGRHKATRCFQALRIAVNNELEELKKALKSSTAVLRDHGRLCVISFHSLEDRIVKNFIRDETRGRSLPAGLPLTFEQTEKLRLATATMEPVGGAVKAGEAELKNNIRSRSATLRICERLERLKI